MSTYTGLKTSGQTAIGYAPKMQRVSVEQLLAGLPPASAEQVAILDHVKRGRRDLVINACAGSGKTTGLKQIVAALRSRSVIYCAFSKEMEREVKPQLFGLCEVKTTYACGFAAVRREFRDELIQDCVKEDKYKRLAKVEARILASELRQANQTAAVQTPSDKDFSKALDALVHLCQMNLIDPLNLDALYELAAHHDVESPVELEDLAPVVRRILEKGIKQVETEGIISYGDMVWLPHILDLPAAEQFLYVLVDEAQDINKAQFSLLQKMRAPGGMMIFVGDRNQAIFGFAGADAASFETIITKTSAAILPLNTCYRCPQSAIRLAQAYVPQIVAAPNAPEGKISTIDYNALMREAQEGDMVLSRKCAPLVRQCLAFIAARIPARIKGKDVGKTLTGFIEQVAEQYGFTYAGFGEYLDRFVNRKAARLNSKDGNEAAVETLYDTADAVMVCFENFVECDSIECLTQAIDSLFTDGRAGVTLSTVHRAKGLEAERVFILEPENLPFVWRNQQDWQYQQEVNLAYVAYTRVKYNRKTGAEGELFFVA
jgi:superfamily I DNA/RNA helicase